MKMRYRMFRRGATWYVDDSQPEDKNSKVSCRQKSLGTKSKSEAERQLAIMNEPYRFAAYNLQMARTHLQMSSPELTKRTWQQVMHAAVQTKHGSTKIRYERAVIDPAFDDIRDSLVMETTSDDFFKVLRNGTVSTNVYLRRWHDCALDMNWL